MESTFTFSQISKINDLLPPGIMLDPQRTRRKRRRVGYTREPMRTLKRESGIGQDIGLKYGGKAALRCHRELQQLKRHEFAGPFLQPVDPVELGLPDYTTVIQVPMDLNTVEKNLKSGKYSNSNEFATDIRRIWLNSFRYNAYKSEMFYMTLEISSFFERQFKNLANMVFSTEDQAMKRNKETLKNYMTRPMSSGEKWLLANSLLHLPEKQKVFINKMIKLKSAENEEKVQTYIDSLPATACRLLEKYIKLSHQAARRRNTAPIYTV